MVYINGEKYIFLSVGEEEIARELNNGLIRVYSSILYKDECLVRAITRVKEGYNFTSDKDYIKPNIEIKVKGITVIPLDVEIVKVHKVYMEKYNIKVPYYVLTIKIGTFILKPEQNNKATLDFIVTSKGGRFIVW